MSHRPPVVDMGYTHVPITTECNKSFDCNELTLVNNGTVSAIIDGQFTLAPGAAITYVAWPHERNITVYNIYPATKGVNGFLVIAICKNYK